MEKFNGNGLESYQCEIAKEGDRLKTINIRIFGIVQGVGFRPFVSRAADAAGVKGTVANKGSYVEVLAQGSDEQLNNFVDTIKHCPPERSVILGVDVTDCEGEYTFTSFEIIESEKEYGDIFVSPDIATCDKCREELFDKTNKRYLHPFINCTQCGPRLTIMDTMPYDRERTTMGEFPMCPDCAAEYTEPATRRYDAQPVCCNDCGPEVYIIGTDLKGGAAITETRRQIMSGKIVAIKGIGGFHLCCDAKNAEAVQRLRQLKNRPMKPFALMMRDFETVCRECYVKDGQEEYLKGWQKPIMLLDKRENCTISENIAPDNMTVGVMLPYAPVQMLLFDYPDDVKMSDCLVMTSGNVRGAPICRSDEDALKEIAGFCDMILSHNRKILLRADDTVTDWLFDKPYMIRRSRGFAPLPFMLEHGKNKHVLAIGGELKNTFCIAKNGLLYPLPYVGDMADIRTVEALKESVERMCGLLETKPEIVVCDTHPMYNTVAFAEEYAKENGIPLLKVQHHYAHILSCMAENGCDDKVIGVSYDGTGYGEDGTIWGGELMLCDYKGFERVGSIAPFIQSGGDISA
ncbi:MAG: carbamoyltransferase HypF, partial [Firmicutes bacterium]|nr:carbamoyltransferase HypF [Bacillota bacterium]